MFLKHYRNLEEEIKTEVWSILISIHGDNVNISWNFGGWSMWVSPASPSMTTQRVVAGAGPLLEQRNFMEGQQSQEYKTHNSELASLPQWSTFKGLLLARSRAPTSSPSLRTPRRWVRHRVLQQGCWCTLSVDPGGMLQQRLLPSSSLPSPRQQLLPHRCSNPPT